MTRTPEEIKKGLECCMKGNCTDCPYRKLYRVFRCKTERTRDAIGYIRKLEEENERTMKCYDAAVCETADVAAMLPKWTSVKERLPEHWHMDDKDRTLINYLVYSPDYGVDVGNYIKSAKRWVCMGLPMNVTHWMPLPEPPEVTKP